ncbi:hypothetical protein CRD60_00955 [Bifidobacterium aemilianum]|uniref:tRNA nuclease CdiA C-terminal domain-containing protein n=1 Tax=Bifidobacterium aemilianum TaxID=2493120 RepID=A0A366K9P1_9BIFI|nr:hypothetical protein CRD60_00955 [Bifidobacterium aemilianum]
MKSLLKGLKGMGPEWQRDILLDRIPQLAAKYGDIAATAAAQWYEETRAKQVPGDYEALTADPFPGEAIQERLRYGAKDLFADGGDDEFASWLEGALQRWVAYSGRETIGLNVMHDPAKPRFARVPTGARTCAWCEIMCSRGFVYHSKTTALERHGSGRLYHDRCDCQAVPEWDRERAHVEGYDPEAMYQRYQAAFDAAGGPGASDREVARQLRILYPDRYKDGLNVRTQAIAKADVKPAAKGSLHVPDGASLNAVERRAAEQLAAMGYHVTANPVVNEMRRRNPDFTLDGETWELKTPRGSGKNTINNILRKAGRQSPNVVVDLTSCPIETETVINDCKHRLARVEGRLRQIMIIEDGKLVKLLQRD